MRAIDTNVLVGLFTRDDPRQTAIADAFVEQGAWLPLLALAEAIWVLDAVWSLDPRQLATAIEMLLHHKKLTPQEKLTPQDSEVATASLHYCAIGRH
jgi:predicted nucleic-acid-binding protein